MRQYNAAAILLLLFVLCAGCGGAGAGLIGLAVKDATDNGGGDLTGTTVRLTVSAPAAGPQLAPSRSGAGFSVQLILPDATALPMTDQGDGRYQLTTTARLTDGLAIRAQRTGKVLQKYFQRPLVEGTEFDAGVVDSQSTIATQIAIGTANRQLGLSLRSEMELAAHFADAGLTASLDAILFRVLGNFPGDAYASGTALHTLLAGKISGDGLDETLIDPTIIRNLVPVTPPRPPETLRGTYSGNYESGDVTGSVSLTIEGGQILGSFRNSRSGEGSIRGKLGLAGAFQLTARYLSGETRQVQGILSLNGGGQLEGVFEEPQPDGSPFRALVVFQQAVTAPFRTD